MPIFRMQVPRLYLRCRYVFLPVRREPINSAASDFDNEAASPLVELKSKRIYAAFA